VKKPKRKHNMSEPAYLDVDQQQWTGRQIFLAGIRLDAGFVDQFRMHDSVDPTSQIVVGASFPGAGTVATYAIPAGGGVIATGNASSTFGPVQFFGGGITVGANGTQGVLLNTDSSIDADPILVQINEAIANSFLYLKYAMPAGANRTQRFQDGDGFIALQGTAGGLAVHRAAVSVGCRAGVRSKSRHELASMGAVAPGNVRESDIS